MRLDYFYNTEGENFRFYQIPALLLEEEEYRGISDTAKILYGVLLSRLALSRKNSWIEKDTGRLYITYNLKQLVEKLGRSDRTISKAMKQLSEVGLIEKKKRGQGKPDIIYVMNFTAVHKEGTKETVPEEQMEQNLPEDKMQGNKREETIAETSITGKEDQRGDSRSEEMDIHSNNNHIMMVTDQFITEAIQKGYILPEGRSVHEISIDLCMIVKGIIFTWVAERGRFDLPAVTRDMYKKRYVQKSSGGHPACLRIYIRIQKTPSGCFQAAVTPLNFRMVLLFVNDIIDYAFDRWSDMNQGSDDILPFISPQR